MPKKSTADVIEFEGVSFPVRHLDEMRDMLEDFSGLEDKESPAAEKLRLDYRVFVIVEGKEKTRAIRSYLRINEGLG